MKVKKISFALLLVGGLVFNSCNNDDDNNNQTTVNQEVVVVANRAASSISFFNADDNALIEHLSIPNSAPMYVVYVPSTDKIYVGDRSQNTVHVINPDTKAIERSISVGNGVFHMWADGSGNQLWVNNDDDNTISVINLQTNSVIQTIPVDLKPHDVFVNSAGTRAYVSIINSDTNEPDKIYMYNTSTFEKINEISVGKDPHLYHMNTLNRLFVANQSGILISLNGDTFEIIEEINLEGAHGIFGAVNESFLYLTNISGNQLYTVNPSSGLQVGNAINALNMVPHNIVVNENGDKMFVTHSGANATAVSTYSISNGVVSPQTSLTAQTNPFGLAYYKRTVNN